MILDVGELIRALEPGNTFVLDNAQIQVTTEAGEVFNITEVEITHSGGVVLLKVERAE